MQTVDAATVDSGNSLIIDARSKFRYELGHIPNAINIPYNSYNSQNLAEIINQHSLKDRRLIIYCSSDKCKAADILANKLLEQGCQNVAVYPGGWEEWQAFKKN